MNTLNNAVVICSRNSKFAVFEADFDLLKDNNTAIEAAYQKASIRFCETPALARREAKRLAAEVKARVRLQAGILDYTKATDTTPYTVITSNMKTRKAKKTRK